jgi:serine protease inhibitor
MKRRLPLLVISVLIATGCSVGPSPSSLPAGIDLARASTARASADPTTASTAADAINALGLDLYPRIGTGGENLVFSPASIGLALAMARAGAAGTTASEMDAVLRGLGSDGLAESLNALDAALASRTGTVTLPGGETADLTLRIANGSFAQQGMTLVPAYLDALASRFGAGQWLVDYARDPEAARKAINAWVDDRTEQRIPELLPAGLITNLTRLTLVNAIYLKAPWATPFSESATSSEPFTRLDGSAVDVAMLRATIEARYARGSGWQALELPYAGGTLAMTVILPSDLASFEQELTPATVADVTGALDDALVELRFPKFDIETKADLRDILVALGMPAAFDGSLADFSGITTDERLYITAVMHQANITVDEKGTEAAAATAVVMGKTSVPTQRVTLSVDHPFLFLLRDVQTGAVLFLGRITDPSLTR